VREAPITNHLSRASRLALRHPARPRLIPLSALASVDRLSGLSRIVGGKIMASSNGSYYEFYRGSTCVIRACPACNRN
jgi:hypothetical protein